MSNAAGRFKHQIEMLLKNDSDISKELAEAWHTLKADSDTPEKDYESLVDWTCEQLRLQAQKIADAEPVEED